jgi:hypothetical protein
VLSVHAAFGAPEFGGGLRTSVYVRKPVPRSRPSDIRGKDARMTNPELSLIAALLDRSGSMEDRKKTTESGFDDRQTSFAERRSACDTLDVRRSVQQPLGERADRSPSQADPVPRNMMALLYAPGRFITEIGEHLPNRPGMVTDGLENARIE